MRFPPTIGVVGFDFGYKPAFSVAVGRQLKIKQQDDDGPFIRCHQSLGDFILVAISGVLACLDCYSIDTGSGMQDVKFSLSGVNGSFTALWDGSAFWTVTIGSATVKFYSSSDGSCSGDPSESTGDVILSLSCSGDNLFSALAFAGAAITVGVFQNLLGTPFGDPMNNVLTPTECATGTAPSFIGAHGGVITLSV